MISSSISKKGESIGVRELNQKINLIDTKWDSFEDKITVYVVIERSPFS